MKTKLILAGAVLFCGAALTSQAQYESSATTPPVTAAPRDTFGPAAGDWELTLGGSGSSNKDFDNSSGGINVSLGYYFSSTLELSVRQSGSYSNGSGDSAEYDGSTFVALDHHFGNGQLRPFVGVNVGALYGDNTSDTWAAGLEGGLKFYVKPQTFLYALVNYAWTFDDADKADNNFDEGAFLWSVGIGFNF